MEWVALVTWVVTALFGFSMLAGYLRRGGHRQPGGIPAPLLFAHFLLAAAGLVIWVIYLVSDSSALAWLAFAALVVVAVAGWAMFGIWAKGRQAPAVVGEALPAERGFPVPVVVLHGLFAVATVVLVLLTAAGVGESS